jgi:glutamyl-tRNA synthetase
MHLLFNYRKPIFNKFISCRYFEIKKKLSSIQEVRVRFAPSPTGKLHIGGLRTAFYNFLFAKKYNGKFLLRIEDTDQDRLKENSIENIIESLKWAGIERIFIFLVFSLKIKIYLFFFDVADYGPHKKQPDDQEQGAPWFQSERIQFYHEHVEILLQKKKAYHCFCDENRLILLRHNAAKRQEKIGYDGIKKFFLFKWKNIYRIGFNANQKYFTKLNKRNKIQLLIIEKN